MSKTYSEKLIADLDNWYTEQTYDGNFKVMEGRPGVYILIHLHIDQFDKTIKHNILYVGSSKNLKARHRSHEVLRMLKMHYDYIRTYFKYCDDFLEAEKYLIGKLQPKYNVQWR